MVSHMWTIFLEVWDVQKFVDLALRKIQLESNQMKNFLLFNATKFYALIAK